MADPRSIPEWIPPSRLRDAWREEIRCSLVGLALSVGVPTAVGCALSVRLLSSQGDLAAFVALFGGMGFGLLAVSPVAKATDAWRDARQRRRSLDLLDARGEVTLGREFVGIAYTERLWHYPKLGHDLDVGVIHMGLDGLWFAGIETSFNLPANSILGTEIRYLDTALHGPEPRLYMRWAYGGKGGTFSLAHPTQRSVQRRVVEMRKFRDRLERWRTESFATQMGCPISPPTILEPMVSVDPVKRAGLPAKLLAVPATILLLGLVELVASGAAMRMNLPRAGTILMWLIVLSGGVWSLLAAMIESRLPERWRCRETLSKTVARHLGERRIDEADEAQVNAR